MKENGKIKIIVIFFLLVCTLLKLQKDAYISNNIYFELSHSGHENDSICLNAYDSYYALSKDNVLMWTYGRGKLDYGTYGTYFDDISEKGYLILTDSEAKKLKSHIKKICRNYTPVRSDSVVGSYDYSEFFIKVNGKFYEQSLINRKFDLSEEELRGYTNDMFWELKDDLSFFSVEKEILNIIEGYHNKYGEDAKDYIITVANCTTYNYDEFQKKSNQ